MTNYDYIIIGAGPAGLLAAYELANRTNKSIALFEEGAFRNNNVKCTMQTKMLCSNCKSCSIISGFGGCVSPSNAAKLSFPPSGKKLIDVIGQKQYYCLAKYVWKVYSTFAQINLPYPKMIRNNKINDLIDKSELILNDYPIHVADEREHDNFIRNIFYFLKEKITIFLNTKIDLANELNVQNQTIKTSNNVFQYKKLILATGRAGYADTRQFLLKNHMNETSENINIGLRLLLPSEFLVTISDTYPDFKVKYNSNGYELETFCFSNNVQGGKIKYLNCKEFLNVDGHISVLSPGDRISNKLYGNFAILCKNTRDKINYENVLMRKNRFKGKNFNELIKENWIIFRNYETSSLASFFAPKEYDEIVQFATQLLQFISKLNNIEIDKLINNVKVIGPEIENIWGKAKLQNNFTLSDNIYIIGDCTGLAQGIISSMIMGVHVGRLII